MGVDVEGTIQAPTTALKALAEPLRWRIVELLAHEELCVCHLTDELGVAQPLVSHHLKVLRDAGLVESQRWRAWTYYRLRPGAVDGVGAALTDLGSRCPDAGERRRPCG
jgi:ArsR family transcriptional regulator